MEWIATPNNVSTTNIVSSEICLFVFCTSTYTCTSNFPEPCPQKAHP